MNYKVHPKEKFYFLCMSLINVVLYGILLFMVSATALVGLVVFYGLLVLFLKTLSSLFFVGYLKGNAIKVHNKQFPNIFEILQDHSKKLGLSQVPDLYILQGNGILNALATRALGRDFVVLYSDILELAYQEGIEEVSFIIGHELGHIKRGHLSFKSLLIWPAKMIPFLGSAYSRACEYTSDNIGYSLSPKGAVKGILVLAAGKKLYKRVDVDALSLRFETLDIWVAELFSTHPHLMKRVANIKQLDNEHKDYLFDSSAFISPKIDDKNAEMHQR